MKPNWLVVISFTLTFDLLVSVLPRSCRLDAKVLICTRLNFGLYRIHTIITYENVVDFLFFSSGRISCNCRIINLVKTLRLTDVITVTMKPCTLKDLKRCKVDTVVTDPQLVAGLVVSREDPRRNWAIKHHVKNLLKKIRNLQHADLRSFLYNSLLRDVQEEVKRLKSPETLFSKSYADFMEGPFSVTPSGLTPPTTETAAQKMFHRWKLMAVEFGKMIQSFNTVTTPPTTTSTKSFDESEFKVKADFLAAQIALMMRPQRRGKRADTVVLRRNLSKIGLTKSDKKTDTNFIPAIADSLPVYSNNSQPAVADSLPVYSNNSQPAIADSLPVYSNNSQPAIAEMLSRTKRLIRFASVVPYRAYASGQYYSLYDTGAIWLALGKRPLVKSYRAPRRKYGVVRPVTREARRFTSPGPFVTTTGKGPQLSPAEISGMSKEADHRIRSFIIFFVSITGVITVIAVLLVMAMKGKSDSQETVKCQQKNRKCRCCDGFLLQQRQTPRDPNDPMPGRCPWCKPQAHDPMTGRCPWCKPQAQTGTQTENSCHLLFDSKETIPETLSGCQQTNKNDNQQPENSRTTRGKSVFQEKDGFRAEYTLDMIGFGSLQQYQPCLHGDLLTSRTRNAIIRAENANTVKVVSSISSADLLQLETQVSVDSNTANNSNTGNNGNTANNRNTGNNSNTANNSNIDNKSQVDNINIENNCNTINTIDTTDNIDANNNNNNNKILNMAVKEKANVPNEYQTSRMSSSRHRSQVVCKLPRSSPTFHSRPGYNLYDQVYHYVSKCRFYDPPQQCKLARNQDMDAADLTHYKNVDKTDNQTTHYKNVDKTDNQTTICKLTNHDGEKSEYSQDSISSVNSHDCSSLHSSPSLLTVCDSDYANQQVDQKSTVSESSTAANQHVEHKSTVSESSTAANQQVEHKSTVSESLTTANTIRVRSNSCRNNSPAKEELTTRDVSELELKPTHGCLVSRHLDYLPPSTIQTHESQQHEFIKVKFTLPEGPNLGQSSRHDQSLPMSLTINSSRIEGYKNFVASSETRSRLGSSEHTPQRNESVTHKVGVENCGNHHTIDTSEDGHSDTTVSRRSNEPRGNDVQQNTENKNRERKKRKKYVTIGELDINYSKGSKVPGETVLEAPDDPELESGVTIGTTGDMINVIDELAKENKDILPEKEIELKRIGSAEIRERFMMQNSKKGKGKKNPEMKKPKIPSQKPVADVTPNIAVASDTSSAPGKQNSPKNKGDKKKKTGKNPKGDPKKPPPGVKPVSVAQVTGPAPTDSPKKKGDKKSKADKKPQGVDTKKGNRGPDTKLPVNAKKKARKKDPQQEDAGLAEMTAGLSEEEDPGKNLPPETGGIKRQLVIDPDYEGRANLAGVITDDDVVIQRLQSRNEIPFNRYTSLSVLLKAAAIDEDAPIQDQLMVVRKSDINPMHMTTLQPLHHSIPYYISAANKKKSVRIKKSAVVKDKLPPRQPPKTLGDAFRERDLLSEPSGLGTASEFHFPGQGWSCREYGVDWPVRYATQPPYSSPGYDCTGIKQPVGVIPVDPVPWQPVPGLVGARRIQVPAWVSPLYKSYGIGGHMGLKGPFSEPLPVAQQQQKVNKPNVGFFQWLKDLIKRDTPKRPPRRRFPIFKIRERPQKVKKTADLPLVVSLTDILNAQTPAEKDIKLLEPAATGQQPVTRKDSIIEEPFDAQAQLDPNIPPGERRESGGSSVSEPPEKTEPSSVSEPPGETEPSSASEPEETEPSSVSEPEVTEPSDISEPEGETERSSVSGGSNVSEEPGANEDL